MKQHKNESAWIVYMPIIICLLAAYSVLFCAHGEEKYMTVAEWVAIAVGLIGVVGTLIVALLQLKRDGKTIDSISSTTTGIDKDTAIVKVEVQTISTNVSSILPNINTLTASTSKLDFIAQEFEYQKRIKQEFSENAGGRDFLLAGISSIYEENARLAQLHREDQETVVKLVAQVGNLSRRVTQLEKELQDARSKNQQSNPPFDWDPEM